MITRAQITKLASADGVDAKTVGRDYVCVPWAEESESAALGAQALAYYRRHRSIWRSLASIVQRHSGFRSGLSTRFNCMSSTISA